MATSVDREGWLTLGGVRLAALARDASIGTPSYVYDLDAIALEARELKSAFDGAPHLVAYAVKANTAGPVVRALAAEGCGADVVSGGELAVAVGCGIAADAIVFSGVAKTDGEIERAIAAEARGVGAIQLESVEEIARVAARAAALGRRARVSVRINPAVSIDALDTHAHIATGHDEAKFGIPHVDVASALERVRASADLDLVGLTVHVGSQITATAAYVDAARVVFGFARGLRDAGVTSLAFVDTGGGFGIDYGAGCGVRPADFVRAVRAEQARAGLGDLALYVEPGRSMVAAHAVLLATVIQPKIAASRRWLMIDAGMNDLIRPALYQARHRIVPLESNLDARGGASDAEWCVVGPVCESSDDFGIHSLPSVAPKDVALLDAGAYGFTMASRYNGRALPAEVFLRGGTVAVHHAREPVDAWVLDRLRGVGAR
jgi:diaminopimelate decarboxylase